MVERFKSHLIPNDWIENLVRFLIFTLLISIDLSFASSMPTNVAELLREAREKVDVNEESPSFDWDDSIDFDHLLILANQAGIKDSGDISNLRLTTQYMGLMRNSEEMNHIDHILYQSLIYEYYREFQRAIDALKKISDRDMNPTQVIISQQIRLRSLIALGSDHEALFFVRELIRKKSKVLMSWSSFQATVRLINRFQPEYLLDFLVQTIEMQPNRKILFQAINSMINLDFNKFEFGYPFLKKMALSKDLHPELRSWLVKVFQYGKVRSHFRHDGNYLKIRLLVRIQEYQVAEKMTRDFLIKNRQNQSLYLLYAKTLGEILEKVDRKVEAFEIYSGVIERYGRNYQTRDIWQNYAKLLERSSSFHEASKEFEGLVQIYPRRHIRWYQFWTLYRAGRYLDALDLIKKSKQADFLSRDYREPLGVYYWQAKILEKLGRVEEANSIYRHILQNDGGSFYATLIVGLKGERLDLNRLAISLNLNEATNESKIESSINQWTAAHLSTQTYAKWKRQRKSSEFLLPTAFNQLLESQIGNKTSWFIHYPLPEASWLDKVCKIFGIDPLILASVIRAESFYNPIAESPVGAQGLMQIMPYTALKISHELKDQGFKFKDLKNPKLSILYGAYYLKRLLNHFEENLVLALSSYNAGPIKTIEWLEKCGLCEPDEFIESIEYRETRRYVKSILSYYANYKRIYRHELIQEVARLPNRDLSAKGIY